MDSSSGCKVQKISSVMNGMYGCSSFSAFVRTVFKVQSAAAFVGIRLAVQTRLHHLDVPVAELLPDEVVDLLDSDTELIFVQILRYFLCQCIDLGENPFDLLPVSRLDRICSGTALRFLDIHHDETGSRSIPCLRSSAGLDTLPVETHVVARRVSGHQSQTQCICTVLVDDLQRIDTVAK